MMRLLVFTKVILSIIRRPKQHTKKKYGRISGWVPNQAFINSLNPKQSTLVNLECIAAAIRKYEKGLKSPESIPSIKQYLLEKNTRDLAMRIKSKKKDK